MPLVMKLKSNSGPNDFSKYERVVLLGVYRSLDAKLKGIIMRDPRNPKYKQFPYEEVKLSRLRPFDDDVAGFFGIDLRENTEAPESDSIQENEE